MRTRHKRAIWIVGGTALVSAGAAILVRLLVPKKLPSGGHVLADALVNAALADLPDSTTVLGEPDPRWDEILGGKLSPNAWRYFERGYGTTCAVVAGDWMKEAGWPADLINRAPEDGGTATMTSDGQHLAKGSIGAHISKMHDGARARGWLHEPSKGVLPDLAPGDILGTEHDVVDKDGNHTRGEHVDVVLSVTTQDDGTLAIETADGGQPDSQGRQAAKRRTRTVHANGAVVSPGSGNATVAWWIRAEDA